MFYLFFYSYFIFSFVAYYYIGCDRMKTFFIEEDRKSKDIIRKIKKVKKKDNKIIIYRNIINTNLKNKIKIVYLIKKTLEKEKVKQIVITKEMKKDEQFVKLLYSNNIKICSENWIFRQCTDEIINNILNGKKREESEISICVNEVGSVIEEYIYQFAKEFKRINIITNHIGKFKKTEEKLYNEEGILINITNNRRKSLLKSELILNVDFPKELINEFSIYDKSTIINWDEPLKIRKKRFNGKIIEKINIKLSENSEITRFINDNDLQSYDERDICQVLQIIPDGEIHIN